MSTHPPATPADALRALLDAALAQPAGPQRTAALTEVDRALHGEAGLVRALRQARTTDLADREAAGESRASLARELGVTTTRVSQLVDGNSRSRTASRERARAASAARRTVRDEVADRLHEEVVAERANERARLGQPYLERIERGERLRAIAEAEGVPWQRLSTWVAAARAARTDT